MRATGPSLRRHAVWGLAASLMLCACGRGVSEQRVASRGVQPGTEVTDVTEVPPPVDETTSTIPPDPTTTTAPAPTTTSSTPPAPPRPTTTTSPKPGDPCSDLTLTEFPLTATGGKPTELAVAPDGAVWFTDNGVAAVGRLALDGTVRMFPLTLNRQPAGIAVGPSGDIWFTQYAWYDAGRSPGAPGAPPPDPATIGPPAIGRVAPDGTITEFALPTTEGNRMGAPDMGSLPRGIIAGPDGAMWFTEAGADQIGRIAPDGSITEYHLPSRNQVHAYPDGIALGPDGAIWFAETLYGSLGRIDVASKAITEHPIEPRGLAGAGLLATGSDGAFWFGGWDKNLGRMTTAGKTSAFPLTPAQQMNALTAGPDGRLWFADDRSAAIFRVTTKGVVSELLTVPGVPARDWEALGGLSAANDRSVWLATPSSNRILRISCAA